MIKVRNDDMRCGGMVAGHFFPNIPNRCVRSPVADASLVGIGSGGDLAMCLCER